MNRTGSIAAAVAALALGAGVAACGSDDEESSSTADESTAAEESTTAESATDITLTANDVSETEKTFELSATPTADTKSVTFVNEGDEPHVMVFARINEGFTTEEAIELEGEKGSADTVGEAQAAPGEEQTVDIKEPLEPGPYAMLCPIPNKEGTPHFELGQLEEFDIS